MDAEHVSQTCKLASLAFFPCVRLCSQFSVFLICFISFKLAVFTGFALCLTPKNLKSGIGRDLLQYQGLVVGEQVDQNQVKVNRRETLTSIKTIFHASFLV